MKQIIHEHRISIICHLLLAVLVIPVLVLYEKNESLLLINGMHSPTADRVMYHITRLPELAMIVFVVILSAFFEKRVFLSVLIAMSLSGLLILLFKHVLFTGYHRPYEWLSRMQIVFHRVDGIRLHSHGSFPSGHTLSAFCALALAGFISKNGFLQFLLFLLACACAYSRVYVAQHYVMDVYAGALIGFSLAFFIYAFFQLKFKTPYWQKPLIRLQK